MNNFILPIFSLILGNRIPCILNSIWIDPKSPDDFLSSWVSGSSWGQSIECGIFLLGEPTSTEGTFVIAQGREKGVDETDCREIKSGYKVSFKKNKNFLK